MQRSLLKVRGSSPAVPDPTSPSVEPKVFPTGTPKASATVSRTSGSRVSLVEVTAMGSEVEAALTSFWARRWSIEA